MLSPIMNAVLPWMAWLMALDFLQMDLDLILSNNIMATDSIALALIL